MAAPKNDFITAYATANAMADMFRNVKNWNKLDREGVQKCLARIKKAVEPGYKKQMREI